VGLKGTLGKISTVGEWHSWLRALWQHTEKLQVPVVQACTGTSCMQANRRHYTCTWLTGLEHEKANEKALKATSMKT
jgi:hypothetical protein